MFDLDEWNEVLKDTFSCQFDQCRLGLKQSSPPFLPLLKPTQMRSTHETMLKYLKGLKCNNMHPEHGKVNQSSQVWPVGLCSRLARGIAEALIEDGSFFFPTYECPGCRGHVRSSDTRHTRGPDCKFPNVEPMSWSCPACVKNRHRSHSSHTLGPDCQWAIATTRSEGARKHRTGHHPRDPIVKASSEPTSSLRVDLKSADAPSLADRGIEPESLSPEEAARRRKDKSLSATPVPPATSLPLTPKPLSIAPGPPGTPTPGTPGGTTKRRVDASTQADTPESRVVPADAIGPSVEKEESEVAEPSWSQHDLGAVLQQLKSLRPGIVRRALRRLHIRWFHCSASRMKMLLTAAGVKPDILELVDEIVNACSICRMWAKPGPRSIASSSLSTRFNECVQNDLLFVKDFIILHMIDCCIRWSAACVVESKHAEVLLTAMDQLWFRVFGSPQELVGDRESGIALPESSARFLEVRGINLEGTWTTCIFNRASQ